MTRERAEVLVGGLYVALMVALAAVLGSLAGDFCEVVR